jgi:hypothetical protein
MTSLPRFSDILQGHLTHLSHFSDQGIRIAHFGKEYRGNTRGLRLSECFFK